MASTRSGWFLRTCGIAALAAALPITAVQADHGADAAEAPLDAFYGEALEYRSIGPSRGGRVTAVAGHASDTMTYYMGATGGGVWKTENGGASWSVLSDETFKTGSVGAVAVAPSDPNVVVVGMGESPFRGVSSSQGDGVYVSTDAGETWRHVGLEDTRQISAVVIDPNDPDRWFVAAQGDIWAPSDERGIYLTEDGGESWTKVLAGENETTGAVDLKMDPSNPRILYAALWDHQRTPWLIRSGGSGSGIWKSADGGASWTELTDDLPGEMGKIGVAPSGAQPGLVFAVVEAADGKGGVYRSDDGGESWSHVNKTRAVQQRSWYYMDIFADPQDANTVYVLSAPFLRSVDGGKTFSNIRNPHTDQHDLWINPNDPDVMILGNDGGGTVSYDAGRTWSTQNNQPTAQFYRINADNRFPYRIYAGQQDNSTIAIASRGLDGSLGREDFQSIGGGESAFVDFSDAEDMRYIYAGSYLGTISEFDLQTNIRRDVNGYPELAFGVDPKDRKHRFNWNAPIVVSDHNPDVIYHAGEAVFRSTDRGYSWEAISQDLTRNDPEKQGPMGAPITNEVSENYNTIAYLAESPHTGDVMWAGSDDGLVHVTKDGGETWDNVTPAALPESLINAIDPSPHDEDSAYVVATRYKFGDRTPHIYRTDNLGRTWSRIDSGLPDDALFVRVVREDPEVEGLLYAGTETGLYVSWNDGDDWSALQLNLPHTPITDMKVHHGDLVVATQGRGFYVLDSLNVIREGDPEKMADTALALYQPEASVRRETGGGAGGSDASNPAEDDGALIFYRLADVPDLEDSDLVLEILDADGEVVRKFEADVETGEEGSGEHLPYAEGLNVFTWDHRVKSAAPAPGLYHVAGDDDGVTGHRVGPATYKVRLSLGDEVAEAPLTVAWDPRLETSDAQIAEQQETLGALRGMIDGLHRSIAAVDAAKAQASTHKASLEATSGDEALIAAAESLIEEADAWRESVANFKREGFQDVLNFPDRLATDLQFLYGNVDETTTGLTKGMRDRFADLETRWNEAMSARDAFMAGAMADYQAAYAKAKAPGIILPALTESQAEEGAVKAKERAEAEAKADDDLQQN
ncbi:MAG: hypothetical protein AAGH41_02840 [Pseudomonadota bacterium]